MIPWLACPNVIALAAVLVLAVACAESEPDVEIAKPQLFDREQKAGRYLIVPRDRGFKDTASIDGVHICGRPPDGAFVDNDAIRAHFARHGTRFTMSMYENGGLQIQAYKAGKCDVVAIYDYYDVARAKIYLDGAENVAFPLKHFDRPE